MSRTHRHAKQLLNVTTNTMQSAVFRETYAANTTLNQKLSSAELCDKFSRDLIEIGDIIMKGTFGRMHQGVLRQMSSEESEIVKVLIKTVDENASLEQVDLMIKESCVFRGLKHKNLLSITGLCLDAEKRPLALFALPEIGNLKKYLVSLKTSKSTELIHDLSANSNATSLRDKVSLFWAR